MAWWKDLSKDSISGVIVTLVTSGGGLAVGVWLWNYIKQFFHWLITIFTFPITMPLWTFLILSILLLIVLPTIGLVMRHRIASKATEREGSFLGYTSDNIFEMIVSWEWTKALGHSGYSLRDLHMRCPKCGGLLSQHSSIVHYNYSPYPIIKCSFKGCGWKIASDMERLSYGEMQTRLAQEIDRRCFQKFGS
ncbi:hypothetical protein [Cronobacter sakazakii]|uniref:hypothetical protein n=1 Tax=Cronobacter sakazakii TaxID=28141 RepID=UPI0015C568F8|nr:hypothetical protein [Cronobacter sakazakii]